jgi:hypothetical protein
MAVNGRGRGRKEEGGNGDDGTERGREGIPSPLLQPHYHIANCASIYADAHTRPTEQYALNIG